MNSGSYARGDKPRSVPDLDGQGYDAMLRENRQRLEASERTTPPSERGFIGRHPNLGGSLVPVLGSAREAYADYLDGDNLGAAINTGLAITDLFAGGLIAKDLAKGGAKLAGSHTWNATRKWMGKKGLLEARQPGHHWLIPQNGWGKAVPDAIKNQPFNIKGMPSAEVHGRVHGRYAGKSQFNAAKQFWQGTPRYGKAAAAGGLGWLAGPTEPALRRQQ